MDPNSWTTLELMVIAFGGMAYLFGLGFALWQSFRASKRRLYWRVCAVFMLVGTVSLFLIEPSNPNSGEMPEAFAAGVWVMLLGLLGVFIGTVSVMWQRQRSKNN